MSMPTRQENKAYDIMKLCLRGVSLHSLTGAVGDEVHVVGPAVQSRRNEQCEHGHGQIIKPACSNQSMW